MAMAMTMETGGAGNRTEDLVVRAITVEDVSAALAAGLRDFRAAPAYGLAFGAIYAIGGILFFLSTSSSGWGFLSYPLAAGFVLIGPFVAIGIYEVSRRMEAGEKLGWFPVLCSVCGGSRREIGWMALVAIFAFMAWIYVAGFLYAIFFGMTPLDLNDLIGTIFSTPRGAAFFVIGNLAGALLATVVFAVSVMSYPMLLDRDVDFVTAMITSVKAVLKSPGPMLGWGLFIASMVGVAIMPMFLGLVVVLPVLGHASWHLYRRAVPRA